MSEDSNTHHSDPEPVDGQKTVDSFSNFQPDSASGPPTDEDPNTASVDANGRYELKDEIARGGMGVIVHSRDKELQRDLAIKFLRKSKSEQPGASLRFVEEAQIAGQLQHPGIVPIYDVGELEDGRPFFSMKLVKGQTLSQLLKKRSLVGQDLIRFLGIFEQVCQAIAYAHSRHVIHRDLKPANIMVGAFGEVQVMDWGLAKVVGADFSLDEIFEIHPANSPESSNIDLPSDTRDSGIRTKRDVELEAGAESSDLQAHTQLGSVVGTLAYMPPEQAMGQHDLIDKGVDVFALGAILAYILTGKPPYVSDSSKSLLDMAKEGDLTACYQRIEASGCDLRLQAILRAALAPEKSNRTLDAGTLAEKISGYIASVSERLNDAKVESAAARAREEEAVKASVRVQRRSKIAMAMAAIAVLASILAGVGAFFAQRSQTARLEAENASRIVAAELEADTSLRRQAVTRELENQLAICESFIEQSHKQLAGRPDNDSMQRIKKTMTRVRSKLDTDLDDAALKQRHQSLADRLTTLETAIHLVDELEEQHAALVADELDGAERYRFVAGQSGKKAVSKKQLHSAQSYKRFSAWLDSFADQNRQQAADKILEMPPWAQPPIINGLKELQHNYRAPGVSMLAGTATWHALKMTGHETNGSQLSQLRDNSILASGPTPDGENYRLTFSSEVNRFNAFKIEALTDPSLPMMGPGRSFQGDFTITDMNFGIAAREGTNVDSDELSDEVSYSGPSFADAFTTFQSPISDFNAHHWQCVMAPASDQQAILLLEEDALGHDGFHISANFKFNGPGQWGDQSLGRFRVSIASIPDEEAATTFAAEAGEIADQVIAARANPWEQEYWQVRKKRKVNPLITGLLRLARMPAFKQQHSVYTIRLAETLKEKSEPWWINQMNRKCRWHVIDAEDCESNIETEKLDDGSWLVGQPDMAGPEANPSYRHAFRFRTARPIRYLKFESMRDESLPASGPGRGVGTGEFAIAELRLTRNRVPVTFGTARSNFPPAVETDIGRASDSDLLTFWRPKHPQHRPARTAIFPISPDCCRDGLLEYEVVIVSGRPSTAAHDSIGRFRISWCDRDVEFARQDPASVAMEILDDQYMRDPANYATLVSLTRAAALKNPPDHESAANYGWTAYALKPADPDSISIAVRTILRRNPEPGSAELSRAISLARKAKEIDFKSCTIDHVFAQQYDIANAYYGQQQFQQAELAFRTAHSLIPDNFPAPGRWGHCLTEIGNLQRAQEVLLDRFRVSPNEPWLRIHLTQNAIARKEFELAEEYIDPVVANHPKNLFALMHKVRLAEKRGSYSEVVRLLEAHEGVAPLTAHGTGYLYRALFASGRIEEVAKELPAAFLNWPHASELLHDVCLIMAANDQVEQLNDNLKVLKANRPKRLDDIIERVFLSEVKVSEVKLPEKDSPKTLGFRSVDTIERFYKSAVEVVPNSTILDRLDCIIKLKQQKWESAIKDIDDGDNAQSRFSLLAKAWCQFELGDHAAASELVEQSLTADTTDRPHEFRWLQNQLEIRALEPDSPILQIFGPAIQIMSSNP